MTQTRLYYYIILLFLFLISSCGSAKKTIREFEELPQWIKQKPQNDLTYFGVGKSVKTGFPDSYIKAAEKEALSDLAEHISVKINTNSLLYQFDIDNQKSDFYMNKQKIQSSNFLEGYTVSKIYENEQYYWNLIEISKNKYEEIRKRRKRKTLEKSHEYYIAAQEKKEEKDFYNATLYFVKSIETLKPYWGDNTLFSSNNGETIDLTIENINEIHLLFKNIRIEKNKNSINTKRGDLLDKNTCIAILNHSIYGYLEHFPYAVTASFTLGTSKNVFSQKGGKLMIPELEVTSNYKKESLDIIVDGQEILKRMTSDLILRKILNNSIPKPIVSSFQIDISQPLIDIRFTKNEKSLSIQKQKVINYFSQKGIELPSKKSDPCYKLEITVTQSGLNSYFLETKLLAPTKQQLYSKARTVTIDPFVYNTEEKIIQSLYNTIKRKELMSVIEILE
jgi:hypothetical protein